VKVWTVAEKRAEGRVWIDDGKPDWKYASVERTAVAREE
jgi:hypothetical protein